MSANSNTIKFNVGGRHFEVSRDLIDTHSETMLGKLVSDAWQEDPEEEVFIDRNGDIFAYVLDYLRYGSIELPPTIPKSSFERDLDYYGIVPNEGGIKTTSVAELRASLLKEHLNATRKHDMLLFAIEVHHQYVLNYKKGTSYEYVRISGNEMRKALQKDRCDYLCGNDGDVFLNYLGVYFGLRLAKKGDCPLEIDRDYPPTLSGYFYVIKK